MKIGLIKFCIPLDFDVLGNTTNSGVDDRYGFFKELLDRGHEVTIFTPLVRGTKNNPKEERWLTDFEESEIPSDLRFIKKFGYAPAELPIGEYKVDVLICEAGVGNLMFQNKYFQGESDNPENNLIRRFCEVINAHKGLVIYLHSDPSLPFYFRQMAGREYPWGHPKNGYTNSIPDNRQQGWVKNSAWATYDELFSEKQSIVLTRALPKRFEFMLDNFNSDRAGYRDYTNELQFQYVPPAYDYDICKGYSYVAEVQYPLFYSGGDRRRRIAFRKYYEEMGIPTFVSGKWNEEAMEGFDGINFMGWLEDRRALLESINKAGAVVQIQPKDASKMGWWTARTMEVPACKSMCFIDGSIQNARDMVFDNWFVVNGKEDASNKISTFLSLSLSDRIKIIETQLAYCKTYFNWKIFTDVFISICRKNIKFENIKRVVREPYKNQLGKLIEKGYNFKKYDLESLGMDLPVYREDKFYKEEIVISFDKANTEDKTVEIVFNKNDDSIPQLDLESETIRSLPVSSSNTLPFNDFKII